MLLKYRIRDYKKWAEKNREKGSQFQSTLRVKFKVAAVGNTQLAVVREEERPREPQRREPSLQKGSKYSYDVHGWNHSQRTDAGVPRRGNHQQVEGQW